MSLSPYSAVSNFIDTIKPDELRSSGLSFRASEGNNSSRTSIEALSTGLAKKKLLFPFITSMINLMAVNNKQFLGVLGDYIQRLLVINDEPKKVDEYVISEKVIRSADILKMLGDEPNSYQIDDTHDPNEAHGGNTIYHDQFVYRVGQAEFVFTMSYKIASVDSIHDISLRTTSQGVDVPAYSGWVESVDLRNALTDLWREKNQ